MENVKDLCSYDITALFTSVPMDKAVTCMRRKRTNTSLAKICTLRDFFLNCTYFMFDLQADSQSCHGVICLHVCVWYTHVGLRGVHHRNSIETPALLIPLNWWHPNQLQAGSCSDIYQPPEQPGPGHPIHNWGGGRWSAGIFGSLKVTIYHKITHTD